MARALQAVENNVDNSPAEPDGQVAEQPDGQPAEQPKRARGPNKPPPTFLGGLRAQCESYRKRIAGLIDKRDKARVVLDAANRELEAAEAPLRECEAILSRYPELPNLEASEGPGNQPGRPPLPGDDAPDADAPPPAEDDPKRHPPAQPKQPQHPDGSPIMPPDGQPAEQPAG